MLKIHLSTLILFMYCHVCLKAAKKPISMAPPDISISKFESCRGPKRKNCCDCVVGLHGDSDLRFSFNVKEDIETKGKIIGFSNGKEIIRFQFKKPCNNPFLKAVYITAMNATADCVILKGHYKFNLNVMEISNKYSIGLYTPALGNVTFKSTFYSDKCNFVCSIIDVNLK